jgi:hypothetical protein
MQNKPNLGELAGRRNTQLSTILSFHHSGPVLVVQNEPNLPPAAQGPAGQIMQNKANFGESEQGLEAEWRKTKPNLGRMGHLGDGVPGRRRSCKTNPIWWGQMRETKPIWLVGRSPGERNAQNEPNFRRCQVGWGQKDARRAAIVRNEPNLARAPGNGRGWPGDPGGERLCETKPISAGTAGEASALWKRSYGKSYMQ